jgi:hypothetical protein
MIEPSSDSNDLRGFNQETGGIQDKSFDPFAESDLDLVYYLEGEQFVAYSPGLDLLAYGFSEAEAERSFRGLLGLSEQDSR